MNGCCSVRQKWAGGGLDAAGAYGYRHSPRGEMSEPAEGARLLSEYTSLNLYRGFKSLSLRQKMNEMDFA